jgi:rhodanese-related sulfurtransferase
MPTRRVSPEEALGLIEKEGFVYLDVRSVPEFAQGHPAGAFNVPLLHMGPGGQGPNPEFLSVVERAFPREKGLVIGCRTSGRSERAAALLQQAGFTNLVVQRAGFVGADGGFGGEAGWGPKGLPTSRQAEPGRSWEELRGR